jgi:sugar phosphate isomerase/epimerase
MTPDSKKTDVVKRRRKIPIGFQLWAVRGEFSRNVPGTIRKLGELDYKGVEFWGYAGTPMVFKNYTASDLRGLLDENQLKCCGMHVELAALADDNLERTIENNHVLGNKYVTVAAAKENMADTKTIAKLASLLNKAAKLCRPHKVVVGYHAHPFDFEKVNGRFAWEHLFERAEPEVNMQMDVGNCLAGKGDPIAMLKKFPGRTQTIHLKEHKKHTFESTLYEEVFRMCETNSTTQWYIVEMGGVLGNGFKIPKAALGRLRKLGK